MIRRLILSSLMVTFTLSMVSPRANAASHRTTNIHGSACQAMDPQTQHLLYNDVGMFVSSATTSTISVACPVAWSQDGTFSTLQKVVVTLDWKGTGVSGSGPPYSPSCMFYFDLNTGGEIFIPVNGVNNPGTDKVEYVFNSFLAGTTLPLWGSVTGSALYCNDVPVGVGIFGYTVDTCFNSTSSGC